MTHEPDTDPPRDDAHDLTTLLQRLSQGDREIEAVLYERVYGDLQQRAHAMMRRQAVDHTLQSVDLVNEAWMRFSAAEGAAWRDRVHFFRVASRAMRSVLVDHARAKATDKRGGDRVRVALEFDGGAERCSDVSTLELDEALERLKALDVQLQRIAEMYVFGGLTHEEIAGALDLSTRTIERGWRVARDFLRRQLGSTR